MRVIILSWEFPPRVVGKLAGYVKELVVLLTNDDVETHVITYHDFLTGEYEEWKGGKTYRVTNPVRTHIGVLTWVLTLNQEIERAAANVYYRSNGKVDLIDAHDWHFIQAAVTLKRALDLPFIYSIDSLEEHRSHNAHAPFNMAIKSIEWLGLYEAKMIVVKSEWMQKEISRIYNVPQDKIEVVRPTSKRWIRNILDVYDSIS